MLPHSENIVGSTDVVSKMGNWASVVTKLGAEKRLQHSERKVKCKLNGNVVATSGFETL